MPDTCNRSNKPPKPERAPRVPAATNGRKQPEGSRKMTIRLSAAKRVALKTAILAAAITASSPDLPHIRATLKNASKDELLNYAERFALALGDIADDAAGSPLDVDDADDTDDAPEQTAVPAPAPNADVQRDVDALDKLWAAMDVAAYRRAVVSLAERANEPKTIVAAPMPVSGAPASKRIGSRKAGDVFQSLSGHVFGGIDLPIYDAPDAPAIDKLYAFPPTLGSILSRTVKRGKGAFMYGPPGTGKTTLAKQIAARLGRPYVRISCNANTDAATLVGMTVPVAGGDTEFQPGILTHAISRPGVVLLIDEVTTCRDGVAYVLQSLLDDERAVFVDEKGGMTFRLAPDAIVFLADNTDGNGDTTGRFAGTRVLSSAIKNRVQFFRADYMPAALEAHILAGRTGCKRALADLIVQFANVTRIKTTEGELPEAVGFRELQGWCELLCDGETAQNAAEIAFLNAASTDARETLQQLLTTHCAPELIMKAI